MNSKEKIRLVYAFDLIDQVIKRGRKDLMPLDDLKEIVTRELLTVSDLLDPLCKELQKND